jgi:hypothetical protein
MDVFVIKSGVPCFSIILQFKKKKDKKNGNVYFHFSFLSIRLVPTSKVVILLISLITIRLHLCMTSTIRSIMPKKKAKKIVIYWMISQVVKTRGEGDSTARGAIQD